MRGIARRITLAGLLALAFSVVAAASAKAQADLMAPSAGLIAAGASGIATGGAGRLARGARLGMGLWIDRQGTVNFEEVLAGETSVPDLENVLSRDGMVVDLGAGAEFLPRGRGGPVTGLRAGYLAASFGLAWDAYEHTVAGGPEASITAYLRMTVGWAWSR